MSTIRHTAVISLLTLAILCKSSSIHSQDNNPKPEVLTRADIALIRKVVYEGGYIVKTTKGAPPIREVVVSKEVIALHQKDRLSTIRLLLDIVKGGRPEDARTAVAIATGLEMAPRFGVQIANISLESIDKVDSDNLAPFRETWVSHLETMLSKAEKEIKDKK